MLEQAMSVFALLQVVPALPSLLVIQLASCGVFISSPDFALGVAIDPVLPLEDDDSDENLPLTIKLDRPESPDEISLRPC